MAQNDLVLGQNHSLMHGQNQQLYHSHNFTFGENQFLGFGQIHEQDHNGDNQLSLGHNHTPELVLGHTHAHQELALEQTHDRQTHEGKQENENNFNLSQDFRLEVNGDDHIGESDHELALIVHKHEFGFLENHDSEVAHSNELEQGLELGIVQNQKMDDNFQELVIDDHHLLVTPPVVQERALVASPDHELVVGQEFPDVKSCRRALREAAIALHFEIRTVKSDKTRFTAKCASEGCSWRIHAAKLPGVPTFTIRTIHGEHTCRGIAHVGHQQASVEWVASTVEHHLRENPKCKPKEILEEIHRLHGITLTYKQAWRGKERIMASLRGSLEESYRLLPQYCDQVKRTNEGSIASVYADPSDNSFERFFISFQASIFGFINACRPLLGIDTTTPLKSKYLGTLLLATGFDGDGALFPLAFAVVNEENDDNWMWFLAELHKLLEANTENMPRLTILSDRRESIVNAVGSNFPSAFHGFCMRHLSDRFQKEYNSTMLVNLFWEAAQVPTVREFEAKMSEIEEMSREASYWIRSLPADLWATAYFEGTRYGQLTANIVESLNSWILEASGLPIVQMMEYIRRQLMTWFNERREIGMQWNTILVPFAERHVSQALEHAHNYQVLRSNEAQFEVISQGGAYTVDIRSRCCECKAWQLYGLPCDHAVAALLSCRQNVHRFTESCFTVATYRKTYSQTIHPVPDKTLWKELSEVTQSGENNNAEVIINPPKSLRPLGEPRKKRVRTEDQGRVKRVVHCSRCNKPGHFRTTCGETAL